ncbi:MAG: hypothetical protein ACI8QD_000842 [Cyclobacteriaceae bacterium]|jgi:hypothetical protein
MQTYKKWLHLITRFEYWPFSLLYLPIYGYYLFLILRHRSLFFFTSANPTIDFGGMLGERKSEIYDLIPAALAPKTLLFSTGTKAKDVLLQLEEHRISLPIIVKPNIGERGWMVEKIDTLNELHKYLSKVKVEFLVQEYIDYSIELGLFYVHIPGTSQGKITSLTGKGFLSVTGDGKHTIDHLTRQLPRALISFDFSSLKYLEIKDSIPALGENVVLESIGNHSRGTTFINLAEEIDQQLQEVIHNAASKIDGFYFGRLDIRCQSLDDIKKNQHWKIIELNGAGAEPSHIYDPSYSLLAAYRDIIYHLNLLSRVARHNHLQGDRYWSFNRGLAKIKEIRAYNRKHHV